MSIIQNHTLEVCAFDTPERVKHYKESLAKINCDSAYYSYELFASDKNGLLDLHYITYYSETNELRAVMPFALRKITIDGKDTGYFDISSPWGYNGPYFSKTILEDEERSFWELVDNWYKDNRVVTEFLRFSFFDNHKYYSGKAIHTLFNVKGKITDWESFWSNLKSNTRNQFRKAEKTGLTFELWYGDIPSDKIDDFYQVYIGTMDRRDAIDSFYHPLDYFVNFQKHNTSKCAIGLVYKDDKPISTEFFLISDNSIFSFLGGTDSDYFKLRPNEFLKISAVKWANMQDLEYYMIGGGLSNGKEDKLYLYKKKYFPFDEDINFFTGRKIILPEVYSKLVALASGSNPEIESSEGIQQGFFPKYRQVSSK